MPAVLRSFRRSGRRAEPVVVGAHRKPEGVILSYARYLDMLDALDNQAIAVEVDERLASRDGKSVGLDEAANELGFDAGDLKPQ